MARTTLHIVHTPTPFNPDKWSLRIDLPSGRSDWPIQYTDGSIAYDYPTAIPKRVKDKVRQLFATHPALIAK